MTFIQFVVLSNNYKNPYYNNLPCILDFISNLQNLSSKSNLHCLADGLIRADGIGGPLATSSFSVTCDDGVSRPN